MSDLTPKEIRECYSEYRDAWKEIRDEASTDMRYVLGDPWTPEDRAARDDAGRPCLSCDELNQYLNQYLNNLRQNKRAVKTMPKGAGANDDDAKKRSNLIMGIEERSAAQMAYINAGQGAAERSYGFAVIRTEYKDYESFDQEILVKPILNPDTVLLSPNYKQPDASDIPDAFLLDLIPKKKFKERYPAAKVTDFDDEQRADISVTDWVKEKFVQVGEFWKIEHDVSKLLLVETAKGPIIFKEDEWTAAKETGLTGTVKRDRKVEIPKVVQYLTNGVEILDEVPWMGTRIPIVSCFGKELWITEAGMAKRKLISMIRLARDPQMLFAYLSTQECEEAGMIPKVPFIGAKGQFDSDEETWSTLNKIPHAYAQYDVVTDATSQTPLPAPARPQWEPNFQQYELAKDSARRSIQAAMGITPLPTAAQRNNEKSGIALEKIQTQESVGSFHFADNYDRFLHNMGWQLNELITPILDTQRDVAVSKPDGTRVLMQVVGKTSHPIDDSGAYDVQGLAEDHIHTGKGEFDVTVSTGPNYQSEREEQSAFVDTLLENLQTLPIPPPVATKILALAIKMKDLGSIGDEISTLLNPPDPSNLPPEAQAVVGQLQAQIQQLSQENQALHMDRAGRVLEQQTKLQIEQMKGDIAKFEKNVDYITKIVIAQLAAKSKADTTQAQADASQELAALGFHEEHHMQAHEQGHEVGLENLKHGHATELADKAAANAQVQQAQAAEQAQQPNQ
jgi:hypothetical protein